MNDTIFISLISNAALLLSLGLIYDFFYQGKRAAFTILNRITSGLIIGVIAIVLMATPARWGSGIFFDTRTILLGLTGLFFGTIPALLAMAMAGAYRINLGGGGAIMGVATIISSGLIGLAWRYYRFRESKELHLPELYIFGVAVHFVMILCMFLLPQEVIQRAFSTLALPVIIIYPVCTVMLGHLLTSRQRRYRVEDELRAGEEKFRALFESAKDGILLLSSDGNIVSLNTAFADLHGYTVEEMLTMNLKDLDTPESGQMALERLQRVFAGEPMSFEVEHYGKNGQRIPLEVSVNLVVFGDNKYVLGFHRDITERRQAAESLRQSEEKYRKLFEESQDMIFISTYDGKFIDVNPAGVKLLGYQSKEDLIPVMIRDTYANPDDRTRLLKLLHTQGVITDFETKLLRHDGQMVFVSITAAAVTDESGTITTIWGIIRDITERQKLEEQLRQSQKMESIGTLAGGIAHDFNNILSAIIGYGQLAVIKMEPDNPYRRYIENILASADKATYLTQGLLSFSRTRMSSRNHMDLNELLKKTEIFLRRVIGEDIEFKTNLHEYSIVVSADANQIEQVLMNLATNARDAMPRGGSLTITTEQTRLDELFSGYHGYGKPGPYGLITVSDSGIGMAEETRQRIFEPFFTTKEVGKGTGLGLAIIYGIIKQHDGFIDVYSEPGVGTTFRIYLPRIESAVKERTKSEEPASPAGGTETILLAEDDEMLRKLAKSVLEEFGYEVIAAVDGEDAISKFLENRDRIDLLLTDLIMPKKSGKEVYEELRKIQPAIKVIFASGYSPDIVRDKISLGIDAPIVYKPISPMDLLKKVRRVLDEGR